jgi:D-alanyl-D-alanine carboxypeptidase (penicillin-binding protein 5/6)
MKKIISVFISICIMMSLCINAFASKQVVKEDDEINLPTSFVSSVKDDVALDKLPVEIKAKSAVLMDVASGEVLLEYNKDLKVYPASVTKVMTMLLVCEAINERKISLSDMVSCTSNAASKGGSQIWLEEGEQMSVDDLLKATVIGSANDAATLLGEYVSGSEQAFIDLMNKRADELGMENTHFVNATGLDDTTDEHITSAMDVAIMSAELLKYDFIRKYSTVWMDSLRNNKTELVNTNKLVRFYEGTTGLKTGTTAKAGCCVSASALRNSLHLVAVVMGSANSKDRFDTAKKLLDYGFANYTMYTPVYDENINEVVTVTGGREEFINIKLPEIEPMLVKKGEEKKLKVTVDICDSLQAPVSKNQTLGMVDITLDNKSIKQYKIASVREVKKLNLIDSFMMVLNYISTGNCSYPF